MVQGGLLRGRRRQRRLLDLSDPQQHGPTSQAPPGGTNSANFDGVNGFALTQSSSYNANFDYLTNMGAYSDTMSPYGAFDMGGDVWQWNEADINGDGSTRGFRGGAFDNDAVRLASTYDTDIGYAADQFNDTGFRVASVGAGPSPAAWPCCLRAA